MAESDLRETNSKQRSSRIYEWKFLTKFCHYAASVYEEIVEDQMDLRLSAAPPHVYDEVDDNLIERKYSHGINHISITT